MTRAAGLLAEAGYLAAHRARDDRRVCLLSPTAAGSALVARSKARVWPAIEAAVREICDGLEGGLIDQLGGLEDALREKSIHRRALENEGSRL